MKPQFEDAQGSVRIVDQSNFPATTISSAMVVLKPGAVREMHWHPNASEWQYWMQGTGKMTMFASGGKARTMEFHPQDVGYVPPVAGHIIENIGTDDLIFLEMFKNPKYADISLNQWVRRLPEQIVKEHLYLNSEDIKQIPADKEPVRA
jgi:oxalate decarboxylase